MKRAEHLGAKDLVVRQTPLLNDAPLTDTQCYAQEIHNELTAGGPRVYTRVQEASLIKTMNKLFEAKEREAEIEHDEKKKNENRKLQKEISDACLGYATVCFANNNDIGRGPKIHRTLLNPRSINAHGISSLKQLHAVGKLNQKSNESLYHITLLVRPSAIKQEALTKDKATPEYARIEWSDDIKDLIVATNQMLAVVADGNHRATMSEQLAAADIVKLNSTMRDIIAVKAKKTTNSRALSLLTQELEVLTANLEAIGNWHCVVYDWGEFPRGFFLLFVRSILIICRKKMPLKTHQTGMQFCFPSPKMRPFSTNPTPIQMPSCTFLGAWVALDAPESSSTQHFRPIRRVVAQR